MQAADGLKLQLRDVRVNDDEILLNQHEGSWASWLIRCSSLCLLDPQTL